MGCGVGMRNGRGLTGERVGGLEVGDCGLAIGGAVGVVCPAPTESLGTSGWDDSLPDPSGGVVRKVVDSKRFKRSSWAWWRVLQASHRMSTRTDCCAVRIPSSCAAK